MGRLGLRLPLLSCPTYRHRFAWVTSVKQPTALVESLDIVFTRGIGSRRGGHATFQWLEKNHGRRIFLG